MPRARPDDNRVSLRTCFGGGAHTKKLSRKTAFKGTIFLGTYWYPKKCIILRAKMDELRGSQPRFHDVLAFVGLCWILGPWKPGTLEALVLRTKVRDPGSRKSQNTPSPTRRPKMAPDVRLGSIFPWELFTDLFFSDFSVCGGRMGHCRLGPFLDTSKDFTERMTSLKSKPWL